MVSGAVVARMHVIPGATPPAAEVEVELGGETFALPTKVARVLLERLAASVTSAEHYGRGEEYRRALQRQQADRVTNLRTRGPA